MLAVSMLEEAFDLATGGILVCETIVGKASFGDADVALLPVFSVGSLVGVRKGSGRLSEVLVAPFLRPPTVEWGDSSGLSLGLPLDKS